MRTPITRSPLRARRRGDEDGAAAVEFGLIVLPLMVLLIGIIQFSIWFWAYQVGAHAAREGARVAAVNPCDTAAINDRIINRVGTAADGGASPAPVSYGDSDGSGTINPGDEVTVGVSYAVYSVGMFSLPDVSKSATARIEHVPASPSC